MGYWRGFLFCILFSISALAKQTPCTDVVIKVCTLGGEVCVPEVEAIHQEHGPALSKYSSDTTVQDQVRPHDKFGLVALLNNEVAGFVVVEKRRNYFTIKSIAVAAGAQRQGLGRELVEAVLKEARETPGIDDVRVILRMSDESTRHFFSAVGLPQSEVIPNLFDAQTQTGVLHKIATSRNLVNPFVPQLQLDTRPKPEPKKLMVAVLEATYEELLKIDPTIANSR